MADDPNRKAIVPPVDGFTIREVDPTKVSLSPRDGRYERLVRSLRTLPENTPVEIIPEDRNITLASFRATLLSQACRMVPPVKLHTQFNESRTGLVVWRRSASRKGAA
jgi:hypothetical protein